MGGSFSVGRAFGIDIRVHWTFLLLPIFFALYSYQNTGSFVAALVAVVVILALFVCVLLHEFGHSLVAQRLGLEVPDITLLPIGGLARLKSLPDKPADEVKIAIAGPLVNVVLAPIFFAVASLLGANLFAPPDLLGGVGSVGEVIVYLGYINVALAVFNLIPAFPMDGGRVLRGLLATRLGPVRATDISSSIGQLFAIGFFVLGFLSNPFLIL